ncbi:MAG: hypothetical protein ACOCZH_00225 [Phototrophicaceae bacterium]
MEDIGLFAGFILTLMVFSYLLGDNFLYRLAVYIFVGLVAGYITIITVESALIPWFETTVGSDEPVWIGLGLVPVVLGLLLLFKTSSRLGQLGNLGIAFIIGVGAAVAVVGALLGTLIPLASDTADASDATVLDAILIFIGVACSLIYFQYLARRTPQGVTRRFAPVRALSFIGEGVLVVTFGALYAAAIITSLTIFSERLAFLLEPIIGG